MQSQSEQPKQPNLFKFKELNIGQTFWLSAIFASLIFSKTSDTEAVITAVVARAASVTLVGTIVHFMESQQCLIPMDDVSKYAAS